MIVQILCVVMAVILLSWSYTDMMLHQEEKKYFIWSVFLIILVTLSELGCGLFDNTTPENRIWSILFNMLGFGLSPFVFLCESLFYSKKSDKWVYIPAAVNFLLVCLLPIIGCVFFVTPACEYQRGPLFLIYLFSFGFSILVSMLRKLEACIHYPAYFRKRILSSGIVMWGAVLVQVVFPQYHTTWIIVCVYFVLQYALISEICSMVDGFTGLLNKTVFTRQMQYLRVTEGSNMYLLMIDVNDFKIVNDKKGHLYGDKCLIEIAAIVKDSFAPTASVYRFGGDEFCVFLNVASKEQVERYITQLEHKFSEKRKLYEDFPNVAVGYERFHPNINIRTTIDLADEHMYENKRKMKQKM